MSKSVAPLSRGARIVAGGFVVSGIVHLVKPEVFDPLIPVWVPAKNEVIVGSGIAELACAAALVVPRTRRFAGLASAALLVGVFPGNIQMAADAMASDNPALKAASLARLPLQWPMIRAMLKTARA